MIQWWHIPFAWGAVEFGVVVAVFVFVVLVVVVVVGILVVVVEVSPEKKNRLVAKTKRIMNKFIKSKLLCGMYGFSVKSSVTWLNILRLLIRFCFFVHLLSNFKFKLNRKINKILAPFQQEHRRAVRRSKNPEGLVVMCWL